MTLQEWEAKQPYRIEYIGPSGARWAHRETAVQATVADSARLVDRYEAFHLDDYLVSSVTGGAIWFSRKRRGK